MPGLSHPTRYRSSTVVTAAVVMFALGLVAVAAIFVLYATGRHDLPLWLSTSAGVLVPLGLGLALIGLVREARTGNRGSVNRG